MRLGQHAVPSAWRSCQASGLDRFARCDGMDSRANSGRFRQNTSGESGPTPFRSQPRRFGSSKGSGKPSHQVHGSSHRERRRKDPVPRTWPSRLLRVHKKTLFPKWTVHDFRTTFRTHAARAAEVGGLGVPGHVADAVLGHKEATLGFARYTGTGTATFFMKNETLSRSGVHSFSGRWRRRIGDGVLVGSAGRE